MLLVMLTFIIIFFILEDLVPFFQNKLWKQFWVYSVMLALVWVLSVLITLDITLPSPAIPLEKAIAAIFGVKKD